MLSDLLYSDCRLDRSAGLRGDAAWLAARMDDPGSHVVPLRHGRTLIAGGEPPTAAIVHGEAALSLLAGGGQQVLLGCDDAGAACFAVDISNVPDDRLRWIAGCGRFMDLRRIGSQLTAADGSLLAYARAILHWHATHRFCGRCGREAVSGDGGHLRSCTNPDCGEKLFPRTDPVVIMLVTRCHGGSDECLLARQPGWPKGLVSTLAGYVEPGESLEQAVLREIAEEVGQRATRVRYLGSQPWPFPCSLMLAFRAEVEDSQPLHLDPVEIEEAHWFTRDQTKSLSALGLKLPYPGAIARAMIEDWLSEGEAGDCTADRARDGAGDGTGDGAGDRARDGAGPAAAAPC